ncbi:MAG: hypothetical protein ABWY11_10395 [Umezawaea sp.]
MDRKRWWPSAVALAAVVAMTSACAGPPAGEPGSHASTTAASGPARSRGLDELGRGIDLGVVVRDLETGRDLVLRDQDQSFDSASLVKVLIALDSLVSRRDPPEAVVAMLANSDDGEATRMWDEGGGPRIVTTWAERLGLAGTTPPDDPEQWGDTRTTAADLALVYRHLVHDDDGTVVLEGLDGMTDFGLDGFDQRYGIPAAAGGRHWAVKQGWACCRGHRTLHTTGLVGPDNRYLVVVLTDQPAGTPVPEARAKVTDIAAALLTGL